MTIQLIAVDAYDIVIMVQNVVDLIVVDLCYVP